MEKEKEEIQANKEEGGTELVFKMHSSHGLRTFSFGQGKIYNNVVLDDEKMSVDMSPKKCNLIPVVYYSEIVDVSARYKLAFEFMLYTILCVIGAIASPFLLLLGAIFIWAGSNWIIKVTLRNGNVTYVYCSFKNEKEQFVQALKEKANV